VGRELELTLLAKVQPYLWFLGMVLFSFANHVTGLQGMPRRVFDPVYLGAVAAEQWRGLTAVSALGGLLLFASAAFFLLVILGTVLAGRRTDAITIEFAEPLEGPPTARTVFDRFGMWIAVALVLVVLAYAVPLAQHLQMERFGSTGFKPF